MAKTRQSLSERFELRLTRKEAAVLRRSCRKGSITPSQLIRMWIHCLEPAEFPIGVKVRQVPE